MKRKNLGTLVFGFALIAVAILLVGNSSGWWDFSLFFDGWWTLFLIVPGVIGLLNEGVNTGNTILIGVGVLLLLHEQELFAFSWVWIVALILVVAGVSTILNALGLKKKPHYDPPQSHVHHGATNASFDTQDMPAYNVLFSGLEVANTSQNLQGAKICAIFGGVDADFRQAVISHDITITCEAIFGGVEILLPSNVRVQVTGTPVFGGHECKFISSADPAAPIVTIRCSAVFGGIDIK
ncbi:MAG: hypothetical protein J6L88_02590 [Clostridia bacterium]|nr:hypothetical protein [Clostridia bacterium]